MKIRSFLAIALIPQILIINFLKNNPSLIDDYYLRFIYNNLTKINSFLFSKVEIPVGEILYIIIIVLYIYLFVKVISFKLSDFLNLLASTSILYFLFYFLWGLNYFKPSIIDKLDIKSEYEFHVLDETINKVIFEINKESSFLDKDFMDVAMSLNPEDKMIKGERIEKWILRKAFEDYLPKSIVWRQKEQFSDGVGYNWIDTLKKVVEDQISDQKMEEASLRFPIQTPTTKEEYYYRSIFSKHFPSHSAALTVPSVPSIACSSEIAIKWDKSFHNQIDPSGRAIMTVHKK